MVSVSISIYGLLVSNRLNFSHILPLEINKIFKNLFLTRLLDTMFLERGQ